MRKWIAAAAIAAAVVAALLAFVQVGPLVTGTSAVPARAVTVTADGRPGVCQESLVRAGTRVVDVAAADPRRAGGQVQLQDLQGVPQATSVAVRRVEGGLRFTLDRALTENLGGLVCVTAPAGTRLLGDPGRGGLRRGGEPAPGSLALTYRRGETQSLGSAVAEVVGRIGRVRGVFGGAWRGYVVLALVLGGIAGTGWTLAAAARGVRGRRLATAVAGVAVANALAWSLLTPALQIPDEPAHLSYVQDLVEKGSAPRLADPPLLSPELNAVIATTGMPVVNFNPAGTPAWTAAEDRSIRATLAEPRSRVNQGSYPPVGDYPPLYYLALAPVYAATTAAGGTTLDAITPLRALSALLAGVTVLALLALALELFGGRWAVAVPLALLGAYQPVLSWISGGVNPDALFIALTATLFALFARAARRGLSPATAVALALALAAAVLTKVTGLGLVPGWCIGMTLLLWRSRARMRTALFALAGVAVPLVAYAVVNVVVWDRPVLPGGVVQAASSVGSVPAEGAVRVSAFWTYLWQYALPPVGGMTDFFHVPWTVKDLWVPQWMGRFGWYDYGFPTVVNRIALLVFAVVAVAAVWELVRRLRREPVLRVQLVTFALLSGGILIAVARVGYRLRADGINLFEQGRYVMPLIGLYVLAFGLATSRLRDRHGLALTVAVGLAAVHFVGALALTVARYYV